MRAFVTGAMGFLGQHLTKRLWADGWELVVYDRKPRPASWDRYDISRDITRTYIVGDVLDPVSLETALLETRPDVVFHLAALADVRSALKQPREQFQQNFLATRNVLEAMRAAEVKRIAFTSTAVVYGDTPLEAEHASWCLTGERCTCAWTMLSRISERSYCFPQQTSIYGAMKLASEALIEAYCVGYGMTADIYRLVSVVGAGYRHGNLMDFYRKLKTDPHRLQLLGSPTQQKFYIAVQDVIDAMMLTLNRNGRSLPKNAEIWNVSHHEPNSIRDAIASVADALEIPFPELIGGESWPGDLPQLVLDCSKLRAIGWSPRVSIVDSMGATVVDFLERAIA